MTTITILNLPREAHDERASRAARSGRSLQEYLRLSLSELSRRPDPDRVVERIPDRKQATDSRISAQEILEHRYVDRR